MATFDFITGKEFRLALEADYKEMHSSIETGSWKCAQVVAGSVVEALLIDYLISFPNPGRPTKNPLSLDLGEAIAICKSEKILTERTAELCSVVRSYRNLFHPGRVIRLGEPAPERDSAGEAGSTRGFRPETPGTLRRGSLEKLQSWSGRPTR